MSLARRRRGQRGSALMLVPAGVLILFVLGSMAVDSAIAFMAQRELSSLATGVANDAAGSAVSDPAFYQETGTIRVDRAEADALAHDAEVNHGIRGVRDVRVRATVQGGQVCVTATAHIDYIFAKAIPGASTGRTVRGQAVATAVRGDDAVAPSPAGVC